MSKSLGNFITIKDFISKYKDVSFLKMFFLSAHYSHSIDYTDSKIEEARQARERVAIFMDKTALLKPGFSIFKTKFKELEDLRHKFIESMDDDFNTPGALACIFDLVSLGNRNIDNTKFAFRAREILSEFLRILNISLVRVKQESGLGDDAILLKIKERNEARKLKDFALSDRIRQELESQGVILEDTKDGKTTWRRKL
jgi:cysteinyl-tRNA synthetase